MSGSGSGLGGPGVALAGTSGSGRETRATYCENDRRTLLQQREGAIVSENKRRSKAGLPSYEEERKKKFWSRLRARFGEAA